MERKLEFDQDSYWGFLDLEKAYDKINRQMIAPILRLYGVPEEIITMVAAMYRTPTTRVRTCFGKTDAFHVNVGLHQGSALSALIFIIILDYINRRCPSNRGKKLIYADDIAINENTEETLRRSIAKWHEELRNRDMKMSLSKIEVTVVTRTEPAQRPSITTIGQALKQTAAFKYLGSWVHEQGGLDQEIRARVQEIGAAWNNVSGVIYDRRMAIYASWKWRR